MKTGNILEKIIADKEVEVEMKKRIIPQETWMRFPHYNARKISLKQRLLDNNSTGIIAEFKRKSPSKGVINANAELEDVLETYEAGGAAGVSILTDELYFGGLNDDIINGRSAVNIPILRKDFIIDEYQLYESRGIGADVILLIAACLSPAEVKHLASVAKKLKLEVLLEIHNEDELQHICSDVDFVGINNRDLKTFQANINQSIELSQKIPSDKIKIAESGIDSVETVQLLKQHGFRGFLIGEYFMKQADINKSFNTFVQQLKTTTPS